MRLRSSEIVQKSEGLHQKNMAKLAHGTQIAIFFSRKTITFIEKQKMQFYFLLQKYGIPTISFVYDQKNSFQPAGRQR